MSEGYSPSSDMYVRMNLMQLLVVLPVPFLCVSMPQCSVGISKTNFIKPVMHMYHEYLIMPRQYTLFSQSINDKGEHT